ncbi:MAG: GIY-YIG nuclease family protein [Fimbriimonadaceae bacterium]
MSNGGFVYILSNKRNGTLYIGVTSDLNRRIAEHKAKFIKGFSKTHQLTKLIYYEEFPTIEEAILREKQLKKWSRVWKIRLIEQANPSWEDLAADWE